MGGLKTQMTSKHLLVCAAVIVAAVVVAVAVGAASAFLLVALLCPVAMGAMMWMTMGGMGGRGGDR